MIAISSTYKMYKLAATKQIDPMKKSILILLVLFISFNSMAGDGPSFLMLKGSYSMPVGNYASYDLDQGCFTTNGLTLGAEGAWYFNKNLGVGADVSFSLHTVDAIGIANKIIEDAILLNQLYVRSDPYRMITSMAGLYYSIQIIDRLRVEPKFLAGMMFGRTPWQLYEQELYLLGDNYYKITPSNAHAFAFKTGMSVKYRLSDCIALSIHADYSQSQLSFGFYSSDQLVYKDKKITFFDFGMGLVILF